MRRLLDAVFYVVRTGCQWRHLPPPPFFPPSGTVYGYFWADSSSVANTTSAQGAGEVDAETTTEADSGRPGRDRSARERRRGGAGDRAGAWPFTQRDQYGDWARSGTGRQLRRRVGTGRGGSAMGPVGTSDQAGSPLFAEVANLLRLPPEQIAGRRKRLEDGTEMSSGLRVSHEAIYQAIYAVPRGELRRELLACLRQGKPQRGPRMANGGAGSAPSSTNGQRRWRVPGHWEGDLIKGSSNRSSGGPLVQRTSRNAG